MRTMAARASRGAVKGDADGARLVRRLEMGRHWTMLGYRSLGVFARQRSMIRWITVPVNRRQAGREARVRPIDDGVHRLQRALGLEGIAPAANSWRTMPKEKTSQRASTRSPRACSGAM